MSSLHARRTLTAIGRSVVGVLIMVRWLTILGIVSASATCLGVDRLSGELRAVAATVCIAFDSDGRRFALATAAGVRR